MTPERPAPHDDREDAGEDMQAAGDDTVSTPIEGASPDATSWERTSREETTPAGVSSETRAAAATSRTWLCDLCGAPMLDRHCKLVCLRCGYQRDCSDP